MSIEENCGVRRSNSHGEAEALGHQALPPTDDATAKAHAAASFFEAVPRPGAAPPLIPACVDLLLGTGDARPPAPRLQAPLQGRRGEARHLATDLLEFITNIYFKGRLPLVSVSRIVLVCSETASKQRARPLKRGRVWELYCYLPV